MASRPLIAAARTPLQELQDAFCLLKLSGEVVICDQRQIDRVRNGADAGGLQMYRMASGRLLMARHLEGLAMQSDPRKVIADFLVSPNTVEYDQIAFSPVPTPPTTLNLWVGSTVRPAQGDWNVIKTFLLEVIADGDIALFRYLILYLAHMLQLPGDKPGVMLSMIGGQGTGKGSMLRVVERIWPATALLVSDVDHVIGKFNAALEGHYAICMDEALFAGDRRAMDRLKSLVTEPSITVEQKQQPRRTIHSYHRFFTTTNHAHFAHVDADDRRFVFFKVSSARQGDLSYWTGLHAAIDDPAVIAAMVYDLKGYDLTKFHVRERPKTTAHMDQKLRSLKDFDRYWYEVLQSGSFGSLVLTEPSGAWTAPCFVSTSGLMDGWKEYERGQRQYAPRQERELHQALNRLCPSAKKKRPQRRGVGQKRGIYLPDLATARAEFAAALGGEVDWDD